MVRTNFARTFMAIICSSLLASAQSPPPTPQNLTLPKAVRVALEKNPSGRMFPGILKILWAARKISRVRILMLGTLKEWRGKGVDALMYRHIWERAFAKGINWGEAGWILEDNEPMNNALERMGFVVYKRHRLYDRPV